MTKPIGSAVQLGVLLIRWRAGTTLLHRPVGALTSLDRWSFDGGEWHHLPHDVSVRVFGDGPVEIGEATWEDVQRLADDNTREPTAHSLWQDAWAQRHSTPRAALVMGIAAVEVALKELVADLVPHAQWLAENAPSPPVLSILREYLPTLPVRADFGGRVLPPHPDTMDLLKKAIYERNKAAHVGRQVSGERAEEVLGAAWDVLWMCDYYRGHAWAFGNIRKPPE